MRDLMRPSMLSALRELGVSALELSVLKVLVGHTDKWLACFPAYDTIARETFHGRKACIVAVGRLESLGIVEKIGSTYRKGPRGKRLSRPPRSRAMVSTGHHQ